MYTRIQTHAFTLFTIGITALICSNCLAQTQQENVSPSSVAADGAYEKLMSATTYSELEQLAKSWEKELTEQARAKLFLELWGTVYGETQKAELSRMPNNISSEDILHDLDLKAGRAVWAAERLLQAQFATVSSTVTASQLMGIKDGMYEEYTKKLRTKIRDRMQGLSKTERMDQARNPVPLICPDEVMLIPEVLSVDPDPEVRKAVVESKWFNSRILNIMLDKEEDPAIKKQLESLRFRAFAPPLADFPIPEGW